MPLMLAKACRDLADINWNRSRPHLFNWDSFHTSTHSRNITKNSRNVEMSSCSTRYRTNVSMQLPWKIIFILQWVSVPLALHSMEHRIILLPGMIAFILKGVKFQLHQTPKRHINHCAWNDCLRIETEPGGRLNVRSRLTSIGIPMLKIRRSHRPSYL